MPLVSVSKNWSLSWKELRLASWRESTCRRLSLLAEALTAQCSLASGRFFRRKRG
jgi:hypothetical protein